MLTNYLKIALRNLQRNSFYSFINIGGLSIGLACSILILLWVNDELTFDRFHKNHDHLYQAWINGYYDGTINSFTSVPQALADGLKQADAGILRTVKVDWGYEHLLAVGDKRLMMSGHHVGPDFLTMFRFPLLKGDPSKMLQDPTSIVLTESAAKALFGDVDAVNQVIRVNNNADLKVTGILKDIPGNSSFTFQCLLPWSYYLTSEEWIRESEHSWGEFSFQVFAELQPGTDPAAVNENIRELINKNGQDDMRRDVFLYPMDRWRLHSTFKAGVEEGGLIDYVQSFSAIAIFILLIACINFMNLATARSERRAREVGIRKSVGSRRSELIAQFIGESMLISIVAYLFALLFVEVSLPFYNTLVNKTLSIDYGTVLFWAFTTCIILFTGLLSGSYPAFYLSAFQPATVLKGKSISTQRAGTPRKVLVTLQFAFSITLISGTIVIYSQIQHFKNRSLGYEQENLLVVENTADLDQHFDALKTEVLASGVAESVTKSQAPITSIYSNNFVEWPGKPEGDQVLFTTLRTEYDFTKTMGIQLIAGRDFSPEFPGDTASVIVNQTAIELMGLSDPLGEKLTIWDRQFTLIGITEDLLMGSVSRDIPPMFMVLIPEAGGFITIRASPTDDLPETIRKIEAIFTKHNPAYPFEYTFADIEYAKKFTSIGMIGKLANLFAFLAILITCLGLFGLAAFTAEQRTKEIGIRKVLGASVPALVALISRDFSRLVIIAFGFAAPIAWWVMNSYLERYAYRIEFPLWILPAAGAIALALALIIVSVQALRAATANPVHSLRNE
jgi:ABC-type antimicrobial peptide transport system permease subunit